MKFIKQHYRIILLCSVLPSVAIYYASSVFCSSKYESSVPVCISKQPSVFVPQSMNEDVDQDFLAVTLDNLKQLMGNEDIKKEICLKLFAKYLTLKNAGLDFSSVKHFSNLHESVPSDILILAGETDSITYTNLMLQADEHPFLIKTIHHFDESFFSNTAISYNSVNRAGNSDIITISCITDDPETGMQTLDIILEICRYHFDNLNTDQIIKTIVYCEHQFQNAKNELHLSWEKQQKLRGNVSIGNLQQHEHILNLSIAERERMMLSEKSIKNIENQVNMPNLSVRNQNIAEKIKTLSGLYQNAANNSDSIQAKINQTGLDLKTEVTAVILHLPGDMERKKKVIDEYCNTVTTLERSKVQLAALEDQLKASYQCETLTPGELHEIETCDQKYLKASEELIKSKRFQQKPYIESPIQILGKPNCKEISKYQTLMGASLAGISGFVFSFVLVTLRPFFTRRLRTPYNTELKTGLKVAGIVPDNNKLLSCLNADVIRNTLMYHLLWNYLQTEKKQYKILVTSIYAGDGKTFVCEMISDWFIGKGLKCKIVTPFFEDGVWWVKSHNVVGVKSDPEKSFSDTDVVILKLSPLVTGNYPIEIIRSFNTTFLVCKTDMKWLSFEKKALANYMMHSKHIPQVILNNVEMDVVKNILGKINVENAYHDSGKRISHPEMIRRPVRINKIEQAQQIMKTMPNLGIILNENRQIVYANEAITSLLGLGTMDKLGLRLDEIVSCIYSDMTKTGCVSSKTCQNCSADNTMVKCIKSRKHEVGVRRIQSIMNGQLTSFDFSFSCAPLVVNDVFFVIIYLADVKGEEKKRIEFLKKNVLNTSSDRSVSVLNNLVERGDESGRLVNLIDALKQTHTPITVEFRDNQRFVDALNGKLELQISHASAFNILDSVVCSFQTHEIAQSIKISMAPPFPEVTFSTDVDLLKQILLNMLKSTVKLVALKGIVYTGYERREHSISFYVFNEGVIPEHLQTEMLLRKSVTDENGSDFSMYGMKLLGEKYLRGVVGYKSTKETGTRFCITFRL